MARGATLSNRKRQRNKLNGVNFPTTTYLSSYTLPYGVVLKQTPPARDGAVGARKLRPCVNATNRVEAVSVTRTLIGQRGAEIKNGLYDSLRATAIPRPI